MNKYLIKGKECVNNNWRNFQHTYDEEHLEDAITRVRWKYRKSDRLIIESAFVQVFGSGNEQNKRTGIDG